MDNTEYLSNYEKVLLEKNFIIVSYYLINIILREISNNKKPNIFRNA